MEEGSAIRSGTAEVPAGAPVRRPGPRRTDSDGICPRRSGAASCRPTRGLASWSAPARATSVGTPMVVKSLPVRLVPTGRSLAATTTLTRCGGSGVNCWTAKPAARHRSRATVSRRFRPNQDPQRNLKGRVCRNPRAWARWSLPVFPRPGPARSCWARIEGNTLEGVAEAARSGRARRVVRDV